MQLRRVFIAYRSPLFAQGLCGLLSGVRGLQVVGMGRESPGDGAYEDIQSLRPDVIVLEEGADTALSRILDVAPGGHLVAVSLAHDRIRIYARRDVQGRGVEGIVEAIGQAARGY